jgi:hypothetical protein
MSSLSLSGWITATSRVEALRPDKVCCASQQDVARITSEDLLNRLMGIHQIGYS